MPGNYTQNITLSGAGVTVVWVRCFDGGPAVRRAFRPISTPKPGFPRTGNLWGAYNFRGR